MVEKKKKKMNLNYTHQLRLSPSDNGKKERGGGFEKNVFPRVSQLQISGITKTRGSIENARRRKGG